MWRMCAYIIKCQQHNFVGIINMIENSGIISWYRENCFVYCMFSTKEKQTNHNLERYPNKMHIFTLHESRCFDFLHVFFVAEKEKLLN